MKTIKRHLNLLLVIVFIGLWQIVYMSKVLKGELASPWGVITTFIDYPQILYIGILVLKTLMFSLTAVFLGGSIGYIIGLIGFFGKISIIYKIASAIKSIPVTVLLPVFIAVFGYNNMILPMVSLPIAAMMCVNIWDSCRRLNLQRNQLRKLLNVGIFVYVKDIVFWETIEVAIVTLRTALPYSLALVIVLDYFLGIAKGIGDFLNNAAATYNCNELYAGIFLIAALGILLIAALDKFAKKILVWKM